MWEGAEGYRGAGAGRMHAKHTSRVLAPHAHLPLLTLRAQICMALEEEFVITVPDNDAEKILTVEDAVNFVAAHPQAK